MKNLFSNIKKTALSLIVLGLAIGFSAFTNAQKSTTLAPYYYVNNGNTYTLFSDGTAPDVIGSCTSDDPNPCAIQSATPLTLPLASDNWESSGAERVENSSDGTFAE